jgi:hypothetical protein
MKSIFLWILLLLIIIYMITNLKVYEGMTTIYDYHPHINYIGNDIKGSPYKGVNLNTCKTKCNNKGAQCVGFVMNVNEGTGNCWLKSKLEKTKGKRRVQPGIFTHIKK